MIDAVLMRRLLDAVRPGARVVLLGDQDQLASVEAGTALADLLSQERGGALGPRIARFHVNFRFAHAPTLATAVQAILENTDKSLARALDLLCGRESVVAGDPRPDRVRQLVPTPQRGRPEAALLDQLAAPWLREDTGYAGLLAGHLRAGGLAAAEGAREELLVAFDRYRVLAAHRRGPLGVSGLNAALGVRVRAALSAAWGSRRARLPSQGGLWLGMPVLVTRNTPAADLRNGDIGLVLPSGRELTVVFPVTVDVRRLLREVAIARPPACPPTPPPWR
ncbi:MAG: AAA family ATPase [Deltaproteobacteria bacterium]|nr:AAA family ATPase [Deltaproteobacteria bacterium]